MSYHCTSLGKAILANLEDDRRKVEIFASIRTVTSRAKLEKELRLTRERGYSLDDEEAEAGARCIGAAIFAADGTVAGAISVSGPVSRVSKQRLPFFQAEIGKAAREISSRLGYRAKKTALKQEWTSNPFLKTWTGRKRTSCRGRRLGAATSSSFY